MRRRPGPEAADLTEAVAELLGLETIEPCRGFVEHQQGGPSDDRPREGHRLAFGLRERARQAIGNAVEAEKIERPCDVVAVLRTPPQDHLGERLPPLRALGRHRTLSATVMSSNSSSDWNVRVRLLSAWR